MKKHVLSAVIALAVAPLSLAQTIALWTYETSGSSIAGSGSIFSGILAETGIGQASSVHADALTVWSSPVGNGSLESFSSDHWAIGDYYEFQTTTVGFQDIFVSWDQTRSGTGPTTWDFAYSLDGLNFTLALDNYTLPDISWSSGSPDATLTTSFAVDLNSVAALEDAPAVYFRLIADSAPGGTGGTSRNDNFLVGVGPIPEPSTYALGLLGVATLFFLRRRK